MELINCLRAKSKREGESFLLKDHIKETLIRVKEFKKFIEKNKESLEFSQFLDKNFFKNLVKALFLHDLGKINYKFQKQVFNKAEEGNSEWNEIEKFFEKKWQKIDVNDHEVISILYTYLFLDNSKDSQKIRTAILLHHYNNFYVNREPNIRYIFDDYPDLKEYVDFLIEKKDGIENLLKNLLEFCKENLEDSILKESLGELEKSLDIEKIKKLKEVLEQGYGLSKEIEFYEEIFEDKIDEKWLEFFVFLGCLRRCDYSASGNVKIEQTIKENEKERVINLKHDLYEGILERIKKSVRIENKKIWQEKVLNEKNSKNLVLVAPTGSGKTEFALLWAKKRKRKLIYTLPLRVALNDLFSRFKKLFPKKEKENKNKDFVDILHSTAFIEYLKGKTFGQDIDVGSKLSGAKTFSSPILLTTPDQVFLSSLKYYGFDKLLSVYPLSAIVIDEIQAYNPEMAGIVIKTLQIIKELFGNILVITATFPPYFEKVFKDNRIFSKEEIMNLKDLIKERKVSEKEIKNYSLKRHKIKTIDSSLFYYDDGLKPNEIGMEKLKNLVENNKNKNILLLVNNVGKAINLYKLLTRYYETSKNKEDKEWKGVQKIFTELNLDENNIFLLHSRIIEKEKSERILAIKEALKENKKDLILVSTQIVEASVDIDFDVLITEISPIDSQIQRWGRIWRNKNKHEHYEGNAPNIYIFTYKDKKDEDKKRGALDIDKGTLAIYHPKEVLEKTIEILKEKKNKILTYEDEKELINRVLNGEILERYVSKINETLEWLNYYSAEKRSEAQKVFRTIAGIQVFVPNLNVEDKIYKALCEIIKDKRNWNLPLESERGNSIVKIIREKIKDDSIDKWKILEVLYNYSFNLPIYAFGNFEARNVLFQEGPQMFKGFYILGIKNEKKLEEIKIYGLNKVEKIDIEELLLKENEENIL